MPIHDWTRADVGEWHGFHTSWLALFKRRLNGGLLPDGYYADLERRIGGFEPDALMFEALDEREATDRFEGSSSGEQDDASPAVLAPQMSVMLEAQPSSQYASSTRRVVVRRRGGQAVAFLELTSPGNKDRQTAVGAFARKVARLTRQGLHASIIDLFPPGPHEAAAGLVGEAAEESGFSLPKWPADKPLAIGAIRNGPEPRLFAEPLAVGDALPDLPIFLTPRRFIPLPLEATYVETLEATPAPVREAISA